MERPTRVLNVDPRDPEPAALDEAAAVIRAGGLVAFPTETVYGLGADATNPEAIARIYEAKGRPSFNPLIVHAADAEGARQLVSDWPDRAEVFAAKFWPGPLTIVLPRASSIPDAVTAGRETVGVRVPRTALARELIRRAGRPIAAPSANRSTGISPTEAKHVVKDLDGKIDLILDGGPTEIGLESTVIDLTGTLLRILRFGPVGMMDLMSALMASGRFERIGGNAALWSETHDGRPHSSPGQMSVHYSPRTPTYRMERQSVGRVALPVQGRWALLVIGKGIPAGLASPSLVRELRTPEAATSQLYSTLHELDEMGWDGLLILMPETGSHVGAWEAVHDRLSRAGKPWPTIGYGSYS